MDNVDAPLAVPDTHLANLFDAAFNAGLLASEMGNPQ
jgi:hypothetical protein